MRLSQLTGVPYAGRIAVGPVGAQERAGTHRSPSRESRPGETPASPACRDIELGSADGRGEGVRSDACAGCIVLNMSGRWPPGRPLIMMLSWCRCRGRGVPRWAVDLEDEGGGIEGL